MSVRQSLLAILDQGPCYGYQLRTEFDRRTGSSWPLNAGQIYNTLDRLQRDNLVERGTPDEDGQIYYRITAEGTAEVAQWLGSPVMRSAAARDELAIKLAVAVTLPQVDIVHAIEVQRSASTETLKELTRARDETVAPETSDALAKMLVIDSLIFAAEAELRWLDHAETQLSLAAAAGHATPLPLNTAAPKRGRPVKVEAASAS